MMDSGWPVSSPIKCWTRLGAFARNPIAVGLVLSISAACGSDAPRGRPKERAVASASSRDTSAMSASANRRAEGGVPQFNPDRAVVFSAGDGTRQIAQCSREVRGPVEGAWTPDQETIRRMETLLAPALQKAITHEDPDKSKRKAASGYYRQYFGFVV